MKLLLDDKANCGYALNANEACVFACILKCTRAGKGWYGNTVELAAALPFIISRQTVTRALKKLLSLGLLRVDNNTIWAVQNGRDNDQNGRDNDQNGRDNDQNGLSPTPPIIYNNIKDKDIDSRAVRTRDEHAVPSFLDIKQLFIDKGGIVSPYDELAAQKKWAASSKAFKFALWEKLRSGRWSRPKLEWLIADFPEPQPKDYNGSPEIDFVRDHGRIACFRGHWGFYTNDDIELFEMTTNN